MLWTFCDVVVFQNFSNFTICLEILKAKLYWVMSLGSVDYIAVTDDVDNM